MKKSLFALLLVLATLLAGCGDVTTDLGGGDAGATKAPSSESNEKFTVPGTLKDKNFDIKIVSVEVSKSIKIDGSGIDIPIDAEAGKELLILSIDAKNTSSELMNLGSLLTYADSNSVLPHNYLGKYKDRALFVGAVQPGKTLQTYVIYHMPEGWTEFELSYVDGLTMIASNPIKILRADIA